MTDVAATLHEWVFKGWESIARVVFVGIRVYCFFCAFRGNVPSRK